MRNTGRGLCTVSGRQSMVTDCGVVSIMHHDVELRVSSEAPSCRK